MRVKPWKCGRCGDCCRKPEAVTLTPEEAAELVVVHPRRYAGFVRPSRRHPGFMVMDAGPCTFLAWARDGSARCRAYGQRPYNCRRFMCGRRGCFEPWDPAPVPARVLADPHLRKRYAELQAEAQPWALAHGWTPGTED